MLSLRPSRICGVRFLFSTIVAFGIVSAPAAKAQASAPSGTTWVVTVDVTQMGANGDYDTPHYGVNSNPTTAPNCGTSSQINTNRGDVGVCAGDTVYWNAKTTKGNGYIMVYEWDGVLLSGSTSPHRFYGPAGMNIGGTTASAHPQNGGHGYAVAVYDPDRAAPQPKLVLDDPQIVIGSGVPYALIASMKQNCGDLSRSLERDPQKRLANSLCDQIDELIRIFRLP